MAKSNFRKLYPSGTDDCVSNIFTHTQDISVIKMLNMREGDYVSVEAMIGEQCDNKFFPYAPTCCGPICVGYPQTEFYLEVPNTYRLRLGSCNPESASDPSWFSEVEIYQNIVKSSHITDVTCSQDTQACHKDVFAVSAQTMGVGHNVAVHRNDGESFEIPFNPYYAVTSICENDTAKKQLVECLPMQTIKDNGDETYDVVQPDCEKFTIDTSYESREEDIRRFLNTECYDLPVSNPSVRRRLNVFYEIDENGCGKLVIEQ